MVCSKLSAEIETWSHCKKLQKQRQQTRSMALFPGQLTVWIFIFMQYRMAHKMSCILALYYTTNAVGLHQNKGV